MTYNDKDYFDLITSMKNLYDIINEKLVDKLKSIMISGKMIYDEDTKKFHNDLKWDINKNRNFERVLRNLFIDLSKRTKLNQKHLFFMFLHYYETRRGFEAKAKITFTATQRAFIGNKRVRELGAMETQQSLLKLFQKAKKQIILLGFDLTAGSDPSFIELKNFNKKSTSYDKNIIIFGQKEFLERFKWAWLPEKHKNIKFYRIKNPIKDQLMHAKLALADGEKALITSANFTWGGLDRNLEMGVYIEGAEVIKLKNLINELISSEKTEEVKYEDIIASNPKDRKKK